MDGGFLLDLCWRVVTKSIVVFGVFVWALMISTKWCLGDTLILLVCQGDYSLCLGRTPSTSLAFWVWNTGAFQRLFKPFMAFIATNTRGWVDGHSYPEVRVWRLFGGKALCRWCFFSWKRQHFFSVFPGLGFLWSLSAVELLGRTVLRVHFASLGMGEKTEENGISSNSWDSSHFLYTMWPSLCSKLGKPKVKKVTSIMKHSDRSLKPT